MTIASNTLVQIVGKGFTSGITFFTTVLIANYFGAAGFGDFIKITSFVGLFYLLADFGFNAIFLRDEKEVNFPRLLGLRVLLSFLLTILAIFISLILPFNEQLHLGFTPLVKLGIIMYSFTILTFAIFTTSNTLFQKRLRYDLSVLASSLGSVVTLAFVYVLLKREATLLFLLLPFVLGGALMAVASLLLLRKGGTFPSFDLSFMRRLIERTFPLGLTLVFNLIYFRADSFILALMRPANEVGIYGLAFKFFELPLVIPTFFANALYPILLRKSAKEFSRIITVSSIILLATSLVVTVPLFLGAPLLAVVKEDFLASVLPFRILIVSLPFFFLSSLSQWVLIALSKTTLLAKVYFFSMVLNISLNILFIPQYSFLAASTITAVSEGVVFLATSLFAFRAIRKAN